ncbi:MAG: DNA-binding transcriptional MerR regulator, partial [Paraglaciecola sp.]
MGTFSIKDLEHLSGIKAHTIRIWEQRYELIQPKRTGTNIRFYDDNDLKLILNVSLLKENGFKISKISLMNEGDIQREVLRLTEISLRYPEQIHALTICMVDLDEDRFERLMSTNIQKLGFEKTMLNIIYPFLSKIGILWQTGAINPAQEHFISNLVRQKLIVAIDNQYVSSAVKSKKYILFLPEGELHEMSLLFADYVIKARQNRSIYLGQSLPMVDLEELCKIHKPDF